MGRASSPRAFETSWCVCAYAMKVRTKENQIKAFSCSLFHVLHSPFSLTTGRNLPPADTQIGTDAKAPPWTALTRSFLQRSDNSTPSVAARTQSTPSSTHPYCGRTTSPKQPSVPITHAGSNAAILMGSVKGGSHPQWEVRKPNKWVPASSIRGNLQPDNCKLGCSLPGVGGFDKSNNS